MKNSDWLIKKSGLYHRVVVYHIEKNKLNDPGLIKEIEEMGLSVQLFKQARQDFFKKFNIK